MSLSKKEFLHLCWDHVENVDICTKNELDNILYQMATEYQAAYGENIRKIILYGSYARGTNEEDSDIDIVAIVEGERAVKPIWGISSDLELEYGTIVSSTVIPSKEYDQYKDDLPYYRNIDKEGVVIST